MKSLPPNNFSQETKKLFDAMSLRTPNGRFSIAEVSPVLIYQVEGEPVEAYQHQQLTPVPRKVSNWASLASPDQ